MKKNVTVAMRQDGENVVIVSISNEQLDALVKEQMEAYKGSVQFIDLGLPSGRLWADRNVGSDSTWGTGHYYQYDKAMELGISLPTKDDFKELYDNCVWEWKENYFDGVNGYKVIGNNGNSIFLPAAGYGYGTSLDLLGSSGYYWSSSFLSSAGAYNLFFYSGAINPQNISSRFNGFSVRAVQ